VDVPDRWGVRLPAADRRSGGTHCHRINPTPPGL